MLNYLSNAIIGNEIYFVYGLIALVILLIIVIVIIDKNESKKKKPNLYDTLNLKIITDPYQINEEVIETKQRQSKNIFEDLEPIDEEIIEIKHEYVKNNFEDLEPINEIKIIEEEPKLNEEILDVIENIYVEDELEKTQAQIRVEEITKALEEAEINEKLDKYERFEEEQERNAIISYSELRESFEKLYEENEKIQYLDDDEIPINIDELYKIRDKEENCKKVELEDFTNINHEKTREETNPRFKTSPLISPVYGIQEPPIEIKRVRYDKELDKVSQFLEV